MTDVEKLHRDMTEMQAEQLAFYVQKYEKLAELTRKMGNEPLALILDRLKNGAAEALEQSRALLQGVN